MPRGRKAEFDPEHVRDISVEVYKLSLEDGNKGAVARTLEKDGDNGEKIRARAQAYDSLTRRYMKVLKVDR